MSNAYWQSIDPVTNRPVLHVPGLGPKDPDDPARLNLPIVAVGSQTAAEWIAEQDRDAAVVELTKVGIKFPAAVGQAQAVLDALRKEPVAVPVPTLGDATPAQASTTLRDYIQARAAEVVASDCKAVLVSQAAGRLEKAVRGSLDVVLTGLADRYAEHAAVLTAEAELVTTYRTVAEVAQADETGALLGRFTACRKAAEAMNGYADLVLQLARQPSGSLRSADDAPRLACLVADFTEAINILDYAHASPHILRGAINADNPMGPYLAMLAVGATLSLPLTNAEWSDRIEGYNALVQTAGMQMFRPGVEKAADSP